jgi:hypothetical protein
LVFYDKHKLASLTNDIQDSGRDATSNNIKLVKVFLRAIGGTTEELIRSVVLLENPLNNGIRVPDPNYAKHLPGPWPTKAYRNAHFLARKYQKHSVPS